MRNQANKLLFRAALMLTTAAVLVAITTTAAALAYAAGPGAKPATDFVAAVAELPRQWRYRVRPVTFHHMYRSRR